MLDASTRVAVAAGIGLIDVNVHCFTEAKSVLLCCRRVTVLKKIGKDKATSCGRYYTRVDASSTSAASVYIADQLHIST